MKAEWVIAAGGSLLDEQSPQAFEVEGMSSDSLQSAFCRGQASSKDDIMLPHELPLPTELEYRPRLRSLQTVRNESETTSPIRKQTDSRQ